jgi:glycosyltransferase involved in cell wall biosynthesis
MTTPAHGEEMRVAVLAGTLAQGGAEKQLHYLLRALREARMEVRLFSLTSGEFHEEALRRDGFPPVWIGKSGSPVVRAARLIREIRQFRPDVVHAAHFFANLYSGIAGRWTGTVSTGSLRNDTVHELRSNRLAGPLLMRLPDALIANAHVARANAVSHGVRPERLFVLPNAIDLAEFDRRRADGGLGLPPEGVFRIGCVCRLVPAKRIDRFLEALAWARERNPRVTGVVVGDGPSRASLEARASALGLTPEGVHFTGRREDVPAVMQSVDALAITSDHEGFPNVALEAMAAGIPVVTTPAGDAGSVVLDGTTGRVVGFNDPAELGAVFLAWAGDPGMRRSLGKAGRHRVETEYDYPRFAARAAETVRAIVHTFRRSIRPATTGPASNAPRPHGALS